MRDFRSSARRIADLETLYKSEADDALAESFTSAYERLLTDLPFLEGFWVRWAHTEFRLRKRPSDALHVFEKALKTHNLHHSLVIWVAYLRFLVHVKFTTSPVPSEVLAEFEKAKELIGSHFLSHEFWDLYLEVHPDPVSLLIDILDNQTLHQFAKFFAKVVDILESQTDLSSFKDLMPLEVQNLDLGPEELPQVRNVIVSKLRLKYELHLRRVNIILPYEQKLKNQCFNPLSSDALPWIELIRNSSDPLKVYNRALIACGLDSSLWLSHIRYHHSLRLNADSFSAEECKKNLENAYSVPVSLKLVPVMLHYALWLEFENRPDEATAIYEAAEQHADTNRHYEAAVLQFCQFLSRTSSLEASREHLEHMASKRKSTALEAELQKAAPKPHSKEIPSVRDIIAMSS